MTNPVLTVQVHYDDGHSSLREIHSVPGVTLSPEGTITIESGFTSEGLDVIFDPPTGYSLSQVTITNNALSEESGPDGPWVQVEGLKALCQDGSVQFQDLDASDGRTYCYDLSLIGLSPTATLSLEQTHPKLPDPRLENKGTT